MRKPARDWRREKANKSNKCMGKLQFHLPLQFHGERCILYIFGICSTLSSALIFSSNFEPIFNINFLAQVHLRESQAKLQLVPTWTKPTQCTTVSVLYRVHTSQHIHRHMHLHAATLWAIFQQWITIIVFVHSSHFKLQLLLYNSCESTNA